MGHDGDSRRRRRRGRRRRRRRRGPRQGLAPPLPPPPPPPPGSFSTIDWDLAGAGAEEEEGIFTWHHVELPRGSQRLALNAQFLIEVLCPPLKLQEILALASNGPYCGLVDGALVFRVNSPGPATSPFTLRLAARVTESSLITVSLGRVPRLGFAPAGQSLLSEIPSVGFAAAAAVAAPEEEEEEEGAAAVAAEEGSVVIAEHVLENLLTLNHSEEADNPVPRTVANLVVHVVDTHVDQVQDIVTKLEMDLDAIEIELDKGGSLIKKQMLDDRRFPKMHLNLQRLLQVVSHGEQVFPRVKEKCVSKSWFTNEDVVAFEELIGRLRRLKESLGFITNRVIAVQAGLDSWQSEQINRKLYYLSFLSMIFLPLSIVTGVFGMNVGGVPWTDQKNPELKDGFINVMVICAAILFLLLLCFLFPSLYVRVSSWRSRHALKRSLSVNRRPFVRRNIPNGHHRGDYMRL
ncbi:uncharacterized protein LOC109724814 [Ananas comosus]|uniref:Uncharacterized protein LOC109724814 n=1 Tax=Ananas comosus TaxID=4615 RepID=A0A6P5GN47_ANACO|nr:uncharacterized protein LOC109724814 [Ananas comosus]